MINRKQHIWNTQLVVDEVKSQFNIKVENTYVSTVFRQAFDMRYKKIQRVAFQGNSERSLVLRNLCAKTYFDLLNGDTVLINIDESFFIDTEFRTKKWRLRGETNGVNEKGIAPRLNVFGAVDTDGRVYMSITQVINNHSVFCVFMQKLVAKL